MVQLMREAQLAGPQSSSVHQNDSKTHISNMNLSLSDMFAPISHISSLQLLVAFTTLKDL